MALPGETSFIDYAGNNSTVVPYVIPFPFFVTGDIKVAISPDGVAAFIEQLSSAFIVSRNPDGQGGHLLTVAAQAAPKVVKIYRKVTYTQPTVFQPQGPFPAKTAETALDRLEMQIQQLAALIAGETPLGNVSASGKTWLDDAARALTVPDFKGQTGTQQDDQSLWIAQTVTAGDWAEYRPQRTGKLVLGYTADAGDPVANQAAVAALFAAWAVDAALFAGDNNYNGAAGYDADWAAFADLIAGGKAYPALGNHDIDEAGWQARLDAKFPYLPGNRRYYTVTLGDGLVDLFVLHSGRDSIWDLLEPDGNDSSSVQHAWFVSALAASRARWKIAVFHHPPITAGDGANRVEPNMAWAELSRMDLILCGHTHLIEILKWSNTQLLNVSSPTRVDGGLQATFQGGTSSDGVLWGDDESAACARIVATQERLTVEIWEVGQPYGGERLLHVREARDFTARNLQTETIVVYPANTVLGDNATDFVCRLPAATILREVKVDNAATGVEEFDWTLKGGVVTLANGITSAGDRTSSCKCLVPDDIIPRDTVLSLEWLKSGSDVRAGLQVVLTFERYK